MLRGTRRIRSPLLLACIALSASTGASTTGWVDGPPLPERRWHHAAAASADGYVMAFGGRIYYGPHGRYGHGLGKYGLVFFDPNTQTWERAPRVPPYRERVIVHLSRVSAADRERVTDPSDPRLEETLIEVVNYELPFGGSDAQGRAHYFVGRGSVYFDPHERSWGQAHGPVYHANPAHSDSRWTEGTRPSWDSRSLGATATGPDGRLYLVGGMGFPGEGPWIKKSLLSGLDIYDPSTNTWKRGASMKAARQSLAAAFGGDGKLYVFGGCACSGAIPMYTVGNEEEEIQAHAEAMAQRKSVVETEVYDPKTDTWSTAAPIPTPRMLFAAAPGADGKIYVIGGQTFWGGDPVSLVEVYDPATNRWSRGPSLRIARLGHTASTTGDGTIWVVGGYAGAPGLLDFSRLKAGDKEGPTTSVELLKTKRLP